MEFEFWKDKKVLITGHNGFKGTWLTKCLDKLGAVICGLSLAPEIGNEFEKLTFSKNYINHEADLIDQKSLNSISDFAPDIVFHLAAQAIVKIAKENPRRTFETNVMGTVNLLDEISKTTSVKSVVIVTSDKVYSNKEQMHRYSEDDPLMGSEAYSCSKVCEEQVARSYYESEFKRRKVGVATARASNCFGVGDYHFDRLIPYLERCSYEGKNPEIRNPDSVRPWLYVLDTIMGYITLAERLFNKPNARWENYNFGPKKDELFSVRDISNIICGNSVPVKSKSDYYEAGLLLIDSGRSAEVLGWSPIYNTKDAIEITTSLYRRYFDNGNNDDIYDMAIRDYCERYQKRGTHERSIF